MDSPAPPRPAFFARVEAVLAPNNRITFRQVDPAPGGGWRDTPRGAWGWAEPLPLYRCFRVARAGDLVPCYAVDGETLYGPPIFGPQPWVTP